MNDFATTATCQRGDLPLTLNDRYCRLMGGPDYRLNYTKIGCHARQSSGGCKVHCKHRVRLQKKEKAVALSVPLDIPAPVPEIPVQSIKESVMSSNRSFKRCVGCDKDRLITGRGLCGGCYSRLRKLPDFDLNYPPRPYKCRSKTKKAEILAEKPAGVVAVDDGLNLNDQVQTCLRGKSWLSPLKKDGLQEGQLMPWVGVYLTFGDRDQGLLLELQRESETARWSLADHILYILENVVYERQQVGAANG